jgi:predicted DNA-binding transcriptional regulator YafY
MSAVGQADTEQIFIKLREIFDKVAIDWIQVDFLRWGNGKIGNERFETLKQAIVRKRAVRF